MHVCWHGRIEGVSASTGKVASDLQQPQPSQLHFSLLSSTAAIGSNLEVSIGLLRPRAWLVGSAAGGVYRFGLSSFEIPQPTQVPCST